MNDSGAIEKIFNLNPNESICITKNSDEMIFIGIIKGTGEIAQVYEKLKKIILIDNSEKENEVDYLQSDRLIMTASPNESFSFFVMWVDADEILLGYSRKK